MPGYNKNVLTYKERKSKVALMAIFTPGTTQNAQSDRAVKFENRRETKRF
jgi:hypothetical protein